VWSRLPQSLSVTQIPNLPSTVHFQHDEVWISRHFD
jgi:hypothetical protein